MMNTPSASNDTSPYAASAVPAAMTRTDMIMPPLGVSRRDMKSANIVITGVNAWRGRTGAGAGRVGI